MAKKSKKKVEKKVGKKATKPVKVVKEKKEKGLNAKQLIKDASAGKVNEKKFKDMLTKHYLAQGKDAEWVTKRVKHLWYEVEK